MQGKIVTFYSFKGGVGRTMALANVAFIAAMNGKRVLTMDWDLEAPGLAYYFRGLLDPQDARAVKDARGLMNVLWEWGRTAHSGTPDEVQSLFDKFAQGRPFRECVISLMPKERLPHGAALDYISAGSKKMDAKGQVSYEEALAQFSWPSFMDHYAGGAILEGLRNWSKRNYDLILIDSRTGLADVAGVCTMQMPDEVALCFILNRQNIEGISLVAHAIRHKREEKVRLRAIPMRISQVGTPEESDARARAVSELNRVGGFSVEALNEDFKLAINATEGVPFYETLAALLPQTPAIEVFGTNYRQFASVLIDEQLSLPMLPADWKDTVRRRLQPRHATIAYVNELANAEPLRAAMELDRLIESALEDELDGRELDDSYVLALIDGALSFQIDMSTDEEGAGVGERALDLLRVLYAEDKEKWRQLMADSLERYWNSRSYLLDPEQEVAILEEADGVLAVSNTLSDKLRRLSFRRELARLYHQYGMQEEIAKQQFKEAWQLLSSVKKEYELAGDQLEFVSVIEADLHRIHAEVREREKDSRGAIDAYESGVKALSRVTMDSGRLEANRLRAVLYSRLAILQTVEGRLDIAVENAIRSTEWASRARPLAGVLFRVNAEPVIRLGSTVPAVEFCAIALLQDVARSVAAISTPAIRTLKTTLDLIEKATALARLIGAAKDARVPKLFEALSMLVRSSVEGLIRRRGTVSPQNLGEVLKEVEAFISEVGDRAERSDAETQEWVSLLEGLRRSALKRPRRNSGDT